MSDILDDTGAEYWDRIADDLAREMEAGTGPRVVHLRLELYRVLADRLGRDTAGRAQLDAAVAIAGGSPDVAFSSFRASTLRDSRTRVTALERLAGVLGDAEDVAAVNLATAHLRERQLDDGAGADLDRAAAEQAAPESRNVLLAGLLLALSHKDDGEAQDLLERLAHKTSDAAWRVALCAERAALLVEQGAAVAEIGSVLEEVLGAPGADYVSLGTAARIASASGLHELEVRALERMAEAALSPEAGAEEEAPAGRSWDGFERGAAAAAGQLWSAALIRERRLGDLAGALELVRRIAQIAASPLLASEESRLLAAMGRAEEALVALPGDASSGWRALLALRARRGEEALAAASRIASSPLGAGLLAVAASVGGGAASEEVIGDPLTWLYTHPGHPDASSTAAELARAGTEVPFARKLAEETCAPEAEWPTAEDRAGGARWTVAADAVAGPAAATAGAYLDWATRTESPGLAASLREAAARAAEDAGELERAYGIATEAAGGTMVRQIGRLLHRMARYRELEAHLAETAPVGDPSRRATALHERSMILEYFLDEAALAAEVVDEAVATASDRGEDAAFARWRLALRGSDLAAAADALDGMADEAGVDAPRLHLLAGELALFALGRISDAIRHFEAAAALDGALGVAARLYLSLAHALGADLAASDELYARVRREGRIALDRLWSAESLEARRGVAGGDGVARLLDGGGVAPEAERLWRVIAGGRGDLGARIAALVDPEVTGAAASACRLAAAALDGASAPPPEHPSDPLVRADLALDRAEALEAAGDLTGALEVVERALDGFSAHVGLLAARARLAYAAGRHADAAESHGRLAGFYAYPEEKARQLARAAAIMQDNLGDNRGAERVIREALRRVPDHAEANEILTRILRSRGDEAALAKQIEEQIAASREKPEATDLIALYEEQADRLLAIDDVDGALAAIDKALELEPARLVTHRTRIDLLVVAGRIEDAVQAMLAFADLSADPVEKRSMAWRAAELVGEDLGDVARALEILTPLRNAENEHPTTERIVAKLTHRAGMFEEQAEALSRLADLVEDKAKRLSILLELAKVALESLFDPEMSERSLYRALEIDPADLGSLQMFAQSRDRGDIMPQLERAFEIHRGRVDEEPLDEPRVAEFAELSTLIGDAARVELCRDTIAFLGGKTRGGRTAAARGQPIAPLGPIIESIAHPDEVRCPATAIIQDSAPVTAEAFPTGEHLPEVGRATLLAAGAGDPVTAFLAPWARLLGIEALEVHRIGFDPRCAIPALGENPAIAVSADLTDLDDTRARFFLARSLWRSARGHGAFAEGDAATPLRWVLALAAATLGEEAALPMPTDLELVVIARKALSRKVKKKIVDPCRELLKCSPQQLRAWVAAESFSADRFGLLAAGDLVGIVPLVVEEAAGEAGLRRLGAQAGDTIGKIPRCRELFRYALAGTYLDVSRSLGLIDAGGGR
jgi:tetratricopeptide (TPR) repeat protein